jgi:hypothetical protein
MSATNCRRFMEPQGEKMGAPYQFSASSRGNAASQRAEVLDVGCGVNFRGKGLATGKVTL